MEVIMKWLVSTNVTEVRSFIGATLYLSKFIALFSALVTPLHTITVSGKSFHWRKAQQKYFDELKNKISETSILAVPTLQLPFEVQTDVSGYAMGVVLM